MFFVGRPAGLAQPPPSQGRSYAGHARHVPNGKTMIIREFLMKIKYLGRDAAVGAVSRR